MATLFPASVVGSMPRSRFVRDLINGDSAVPPERAEAAMDAAVRYVVAMQEHAGLDVVSDGEWRRRSYIGVIAELAHGFEIGFNPADGRPWTVVKDKVVSSRPGFIAREAKFLRSITSRRIKVTMPAPALLGERLWDASASSRCYPKREDFVRDCVPVLRRELELLRDSGADIVQIDDPHLCLFVDPDVRLLYDDAERAADFAVDMVNAVVDGISGLKIALHLCRRAGARARGERDHRGGYAAILRQINRLKVDHVTIEFSTPGSGDMAVLRDFRPDLEIGLGCVGVTPGVVDSLETVVARVEQAVKHVDAGRITLNPDCGFAPGSAAPVDLDEVYRKLQIEAEASRVLRERHG
ncbi:MAG: cobalamin-independent methionine synthase II family protein [Alphaproteobacteria bacterium]|nr:cobalamin-independent methionine synthase II family protein [Alphaproteobacteria bacterium]